VARRYLNEVRQVQAEGPYLLGGYCLGGILAMEMARQLREAGEQVGLLAMIEVFNVRSVRWPLPWHIRTINRMFVNPWFHLRNMFAAEGSERLRFFTEKFKVELGRARVEAQVMVARMRRVLHLAPAEEYHHVRVADVYEKALADHDIKPYPGDITLFMPKHCLMGMTDPRGGWDGVVQGGIRLHTLPFGPKGSLTEPYVGQVASLLRGSIDEVIQTQATAAHTDLLVTSEVR
jgi:thioesterase domain-containing protein